MVLAQGQEVEISAAGAGALEHILVGVGWDISKSGANMDVDSSVFLKFRSNNAADLVYYGDTEHTSGCVVHMGDNLVGGKYEGNSDAIDSENINIYLSKVPSDCDRLYFVVNIYACASRKQTFSDIRNMYIRLTNAKNSQVLSEYTVNSNMGNMTGMVIAKAYRRGEKWMFQAIGHAVRVDDVESLEEHCQDY
ncbi:TerD family protein [Eubacteriales bacterium OttesenSCG-928-A19]|nr:TerD family protein [Eubacteriales bacterium OttesenSCG-928-A19]